MLTPQNPTYAYVGAFVEELTREAGVYDVVVCPGSRSTPLTLTIAGFATDVVDYPTPNGKRIRVWVLVDERSAAFFALGLAKTGAPVALVCTSGTAAANFYPAVCEAQQSRLPLIVLTTDRPPELQGVGAPQTMGQQHLYGEHVKWFAEMALPEASPTLMRYSRTMARRAIEMATATPAGAVHLNFPFREPLVNSASTPPLELLPTNEGQGNRSAFAQVERPALSIATADAERYAKTLQAYERGLIVVGSRSGDFQETEAFERALWQLAEKLQFPILADPLSNMRRLAHPLVIDNYEAFLRDGDFVQAAQPEIVIRFGAMPVSKPLLQYLQRYAAGEHLLIDAGNDWRDPAQVVATVIRSDADAYLSGVLPHLATREATEWATLWRGAHQRTKGALTEGVLGFDDLFEGRVFTELSTWLPSGSTLVVGNSMPIRDCDTFFPATESAITIVGNRGVNGIDGMVSTALGVAAQTQQPTLLVVGDLTFYHDLNGLLAAKQYNLNLTIIVINNDGGGIFSFLPQAEHHPDHFEAYFGTPTGLDFRHVTAMYGGSFTRVQQWGDFREAVLTGIQMGGLHVVEVPTNRATNVTMHRQLWAKVSEALQGLFPTKAKQP